MWPGREKPFATASKATRRGPQAVLEMETGAICFNPRANQGRVDYIAGV
jgi:hypothetical protein